MILNNKKNLLVILGPTAIGKTTLSIKLALKLQTEIISCDSRQFFKEMNIGTAVPSNKELASVPHHFIQHKSIHEEYNVGNFEKEALEKLNQIFKKKDTVIMVGGSGLYIDAICKGLNHFPDISKKTREKVREEYEKNGLEWLQIEVNKKDPEYYQIVDKKNTHRLLRCLEVCRESNNTFTSFRKHNTTKRNFETHYLGLQIPRDKLYQKINTRVNIMMDAGLLKEAKNLLQYQKLNALQTVGYRELFNHLNGHQNLERAVELIKQNTRRFAKRQITWLKKYKEAHWFNNEDELIYSICKE